MKLEFPEVEVLHDLGKGSNAIETQPGFFCLP